MPEFEANSVTRIRRGRRAWSFAFAAVTAIAALVMLEGRMRAGQSEPQHGNLLGQSQADVDRKKTGCISCHVSTDGPTMHPPRTQRCKSVDCHRLQPNVVHQRFANPSSAEYEQ